MIELGLETFGDRPLAADGSPTTYAAAIRRVVEEAVVADSLGISAFGVGEHHRPDFSISSPETILAGIATVTERIRLGSSVTVLSSDDPVRVFERFATVDALAGGRAEVILGRGSFTESFPLFGYELQDYDILFEEKIELFSQLLEEKPVTWSGTTRAPLQGADVYPKTESGALRTWVGVGGSPQSVIRAAHYGMPLMLAVIGGEPQRFAPYVELYHRALEQMGKPALPVGMHSQGFVAATDAEAREAFYPAFKTRRDTIGRERGWPPLTPSQFDQEIEHGSLYVGSPETVADKIARATTTLTVDRFDLVYSSGPIDERARMTSVELYGSRVLPLVQELTTQDAA